MDDASRLASSRFAGLTLPILRNLRNRVSHELLASLLHRQLCTVNWLAQFRASVFLHRAVTASEVYWSGFYCLREGCGQFPTNAKVRSARCTPPLSSAICVTIIYVLGAVGRASDSGSKSSSSNYYSAVSYKLCSNSAKSAPY